LLGRHRLTSAAVSVMVPPRRAEVLTVHKVRVSALISSRVDFWLMLLSLMRPQPQDLRIIGCRRAGSAAETGSLMRRVVAAEDAATAAPCRINRRR